MSSVSLYFFKSPLTLLLCIFGWLLPCFPEASSLRYLSKMCPHDFSCLSWRYLLLVWCSFLMYNFQHDITLSFIQSIFILISTESSLRTSFSFPAQHLEPCPIVVCWSRSEHFIIQFHRHLPITHYLWFLHPAQLLTSTEIGIPTRYILNYYTAYHQRMPRIYLKYLTVH